MLPAITFAIKWITVNNLTIGIVGAGGFALFAAKAFKKVPGIRIKWIADIQPLLSGQFAQQLNCTAGSFEEMLRDEETDLIYIATPPFLHYEQSKAALHAGKHVICEKPAALRTIEAEELAKFATENKLLYTVNLMQRYNPLYKTVHAIISQNLLGDFVHGFFENYASDEKLIANHWFWDRDKSGGIFIEHGVHFFDMFYGWFGEGKLLQSFEIARENFPEVADRVQAVVQYGNSPVNFYHGFNQPKLLDRQELRLQFDRGDITLYEWIPVKIRLHALLNSDQLDTILDLIPEASIEKHSTGDHPGVVKGKFREIEFDSLVTITDGNIDEKMNRYEELVMSMIMDQWDWIKDPSHKRVIDETNAVESLRIAEEAGLLAMKL